MADRLNFNQIGVIGLIAVLFILAFLVFKPVLLTVISALILAFVFYPLYKKCLSKLKSKNLTALLFCLGFILIVVLPILFLVPFIIKQIFDIYVYLQKTDLLSPLVEMIPYLSSSPEVSKSLILALNNFTSQLASVVLTKLNNLIFDIPKIFLHTVLILFIFFFGLRDGDKFVVYLQEISPLSKESEEKVFKRFEEITQSVIFGQIIVGLAEGIVTGIGLFVFGVPNALTLTLIATFFGILPIIGPALVWVPVDIWLFLSGRTFTGIGLLIYGVFIISWIDNLLRPVIVGKRTSISPSLILVSMIGGLFIFGVLGLIFGPLIIAYLLLLLEFYKHKKNF